MRVNMKRKNKMDRLAESSKPSQDRLLVSRDEARYALNISMRKLEYLISNKELPVRRIGKRVLINRRALEHFANTR
jgi:excisionase family DNA binding protein